MALTVKILGGHMTKPVYVKPFHEGDRINKPVMVLTQDERLRPLSGVINISDIRELHADGAELEYIIQKFRNIVHCYPQSVWVGETAQFIYQNL